MSIFGLKYCAKIFHVLFYILDIPFLILILNNTMLDFVNANFLTQLINIPTRNDTILDLVLSTNPDIIYDLEIHPGMSDHNAIFFTC
jgi:hypothetical protein